MSIEVQDFKAQEFCSRKLWQLVSDAPANSLSEHQLRDAVAELETRRHYLSELQQIGQLKHAD